MVKIVPVLIGSSIAFVMLSVEPQSVGAAEPPPKKAALDAGVSRTATIAAKMNAAKGNAAKGPLSKEDLELARYMDVLQHDHELLKNLDVLKLLPALED